MNIGDFLNPIISHKPEEIIICILYYADQYRKLPTLTASEIKYFLKQARIAQASTIDVPRLLTTAIPFVDKAGNRGRAILWNLTQLGERRARESLGIPEPKIAIKHDATRLKTMVGSIVDPDIAGYIEEAVLCLSVDARRAAVVFLWAGAIRTIQENVYSHGAAVINPVIKKHYPKAKDIKIVDDFAYINDATTLLAGKDLGIFDKSQYTTLKESLDLRNKCGHPGKYKPGPLKVSSFIEDILNTVFLKP